MSNLQVLISQLIAGDDQRAEVAAHKIVKQGDIALPKLCALFSSGDSEVRWWALRALSLISAPQALTMLQAGLQDDDLAVRQCAALGLKHQPSKTAIPDLIAVLNENDQLIKRLAADALIAIGPDSVPALIQELQRVDSSARAEAARALSFIEDESAIPILFVALNDESMLVQYWAEDGLTRLGIGMTFFSPQ
ncbi:MAG: HEAT repeat domain-containing protein [Chloroflexi bacterium]|nr:HEAT repeat domain-containing protein [Chloroflexota bacterium]